MPNYATERTGASSGSRQAVLEASRRFDTPERLEAALDRLIDLLLKPQRQIRERAKPGGPHRIRRPVRRSRGRLLAR